VKKNLKARTKPSNLTLSDPIGNTLAFFDTPKRIVCLVPSLTETLVDLGLSSLIVGVTKFCIHPEGFRSTTKVIGGTKNPRIDDILALKPDLIIANKEENRKEYIQALQRHVMVYVSDIKNIADTINFVKDMATIFYLDVDGLVDNLRKNDLFHSETLISSCYLIWKDPYMTIGHDTFIHYMMEKYGFYNVYRDLIRYPEVTIASIAQKKPSLILLSSEPYPFNDYHKEELKIHFPDTKIILVDGEMFSWYGTRLLKADKYLNVLKKTFGS
jgi:iron complex transport system substrate-binding protein